MLKTFKDNQIQKYITSSDPHHGIQGIYSDIYFPAYRVVKSTGFCMSNSPFKDLELEIGGGYVAKYGLPYMGFGCFLRRPPR